MMSLIFIVEFFTLFLFPLTYIIIFASLRSHHHRISSTSIWTASEGRNDVVAGSRYVGPQKEECRVCLSDVEEGEEIGELRCCHVFHKVCLDAWVGSGHATCPLCRGRIFAPAVEEDCCSEVVIFRFFSTRSSRRAGRDAGSWWLR